MTFILSLFLRFAKSFRSEILNRGSIILVNTSQFPLWSCTWADSTQPSSDTTNRCVHHNHSSLLHRLSLFWKANRYHVLPTLGFHEHLVVSPRGLSVHFRFPACYSHQQAAHLPKPSTVKAYAQLSRAFAQPLFAEEKRVQHQTAFSFCRLYTGLATEPARSPQKATFYSP